MNIAVSIGGGGFKLTYPIGAILELLRLGHTIVSSDGISGGGLVTSLLIQGDIHILRAVALGGLPGEYPALTNDTHRLKTGKELLAQAGGFRWGWPPATVDLAKLNAFARNDRLWSTYIARLVDASRATIPGYVGVCVWSEAAAPYRSIAHTEPEWPQAVWGSATIGPPLWEPVHWNGKLIVDGGYRVAVPTDDVMRRIDEGVQAPPDMVLSIPTNRDREPTDLPSRGLDKGMVRGVGIMASEIERANLETKFWWPSVEHVVLRPSVHLGGTLESSVELQKARFDHGVQRAREMFQVAA